ncbi:ATP-dependent DNA helicase RecQ [Limnohabitans sp. TS-CS-82]|uniref:RecQ family ATP-dependent DNA helicase n=1 Tax=Limnohabitans sp. TS-CS-82 TaxID=2094193 RepID=UPI001EFFC2DB|nr:DEAD/DEAH box helicase [Limnohabitans sp. TS-CS-82]
MTPTPTHPREFAEQHMHTILARLAGPGAVPRADQVDAVHAVLQPAARVLVVQATGWGKSAVYWAATHAIRSTGAGPTLVVSPLLALMRDQVSAAERAGLKAATVNSTNIDDWDEVFQRLDDDAIDVLLVSPERLGNPRFAARLGALLARVGLIVIDEAHCISDWGFDFRPDYQRLARALLSTPTASVLATTATANERVTLDIGAQLSGDAKGGSAGRHGAGTVTFRGTLARTSLTLSVVPDLSPLQRYAWIADALEQLPGSGIVYVLTVAEAERLTAFLRSCGHAVDAYTGQTDADKRLQVEDRLRHNQVKAVVATSALGMGYDKPDLGFCVHVGSPSTPVAYYQQVGRAGRAVAHAEGVLLPSDADERIWEYFATASIPDAATAAKVLQSLGNDGRSLLEIEADTGVRRGRLEALLKILAVEGVVDKDGSAWRATGVPYVHDTAKWTALAQVRQQEAGIMRQYAHGEGCLMAYLQTALDDPSPAPCGRCSVCTGHLPFPGLTPSQDKLIAARDFLRGMDVDIESRKRWPSGVRRKGNIQGFDAGRAVAFADDPGWVAELQALKMQAFRAQSLNMSGASSSAESGDVPLALLEGAVATLGRWAKSWPARPACVVPLPAPDMALNHALAAHIARRGKLALHDVLRWTGGPAPDDAASTPVVAHLEAAIQWRAQTDLPDLPDGPVLLVASHVRTRWAATVAAALLREHGASQVLLLALHLQP